MQLKIDKPHSHIKSFQPAFQSSTLNHEQMSKISKYSENALYMKERTKQANGNQQCGENKSYAKRNELPKTILIVIERQKKILHL